MPENRKILAKLASTQGGQGPSRGSHCIHLRVVTPAACLYSLDLPSLLTSMSLPPTAHPQISRVLCLHAYAPAAWLGRAMPQIPPRRYACIEPPYSIPPYLHTSIPPRLHACYTPATRLQHSIPARLDVCSAAPELDNSILLRLHAYRTPPGFQMSRTLHSFTSSH